MRAAGRPGRGGSGFQRPGRTDCVAGFERAVAVPTFPWQGLSAARGLRGRACSLSPHFSEGTLRPERGGRARGRPGGPPSCAAPKPGPGSLRDVVADQRPWPSGSASWSQVQPLASSRRSAWKRRASSVNQRTGREIVACLSFWSRLWLNSLRSSQARHRVCNRWEVELGASSLLPEGLSRE